MWVWIIGFVAVCTVIAVVIARRGPGAGYDPSHEATRHDRMHGGGGLYGGGGGGDGGGAG